MLYQWHVKKLYSNGGDTMDEKMRSDILEDIHARLERIENLTKEILSIMEDGKNEVDRKSDDGK